MKLKATCTLCVTADSDCPLVAMLRPRNGQAQWIISDRYDLEPWVPVTEFVDSYGNLCQRLTDCVDGRTVGSAACLGRCDAEQDASLDRLRLGHGGIGPGHGGRLGDP